MKYVRMLLALALVFMVCSAFTMKKGKDKPVYVFGIAASFSDTVVYYTPVQLVDSVVLDHHGFLPRRELYSYQLKNYVEYTLGKPNYTCMIYFSEKKAKLEREASKIIGNYRKDNVSVQMLDGKAFVFEKPKE